MNPIWLAAALIAAALVAADPLSAAAQGSGKTPAGAPRFMTAAEIQKTLIGNTLTGTIRPPGGDAVHHDIYIAPDGTMRGRSRVPPPLSYDNKVSGTWSIERNQFCFHEAAAIMWSCPKFQRRSDSEVLLIDATGRSNLFRISRGNPRGF